MIYVVYYGKKEGYIKIPFANGMTGYVKQLKDKSENKASAIIEDSNGNVIYSQTTQPVSRINYDYEQMLPEETSHGAISIEAMWLPCKIYSKTAFIDYFFKKFWNIFIQKLKFFNI